MAKKKQINPKDKLEREYIIPLRRDWLKVVRHKRTPRAIKFIKTFLAKHMRVEERDIRNVKLDKFLNQEVWFKGIKNPPAKIRVKAVKEEGIVNVELIDIPERIKFQKIREAKLLDEGKKKAEDKKPAEPSDENAPDGVHPEGARTPSGPQNKEQGGKEKTDKEKKEEKEKIKAVAEAGKEQEKAMAKAAKHVSKSEKNVQVQRKALQK
jgi:large subunit ribosomal protein L31e